MALLFVLTTTFLEIGTTFEYLALLPGCFHNKEWLITIKHIRDVICAILHSNPRQKTESGPHSWCSDSTMKSSLSFSSLMPHVIQMLRERGGETPKSPTENVCFRILIAVFLLNTLWEISLRKETSPEAAEHITTQKKERLLGCSRSLSSVLLWLLHPASLIHPASLQLVHTPCAHNSLGFTETQNR